MQCQTKRKVFSGEIDLKFLYKAINNDSKLISELNYFKLLLLKV